MIEVIETVLPHRRDRMRQIERALCHDSRVADYWLADYTITAIVDVVSRDEARAILAECIYGRPRA